MRIPIVAGNWKMNTTVAEAVALADSLAEQIGAIHGVEKVVCPPFVSLDAVHKRLAGSGVLVGAQNAFWEASGAYTGEISVGMLRELVDYVILGHSERRKYFHETDEDVNRKVKAALVAELKVIVCVGEDLVVNDAGGTEAFVEAQIRGAFAGVESLDTVVVAYEPIWAIGTGRPATPEGAGAVIGHIRGVAASLFGADAAQGLRIQYGGSVTPEVFADFAAHPEIDGALVGGASLRADAFVKIVQQAAEAAGSTGSQLAP
ncbi:MAG: triose-phosphate isomerase [Chloroflexi bacterium]|nr:triose-phosphate isomerase [Chloroflexota bacterium]